MNYRIETKKAFRVVGVSAKLDPDPEKNFAAMPLFWGKAAADGTIARLAAMMEGEPMGLLGVSSTTDSANLRYYIAVASSKPLPEGLEEFIVPETTWGIFPGVGSECPAAELEKKIALEWMPASGYEYANSVDVEVFIDPDPSTGRYEVWTPLKKAER